MTCCTGNIWTSCPHCGFACDWKGHFYLQSSWDTIRKTSDLPYLVCVPRLPGSLSFCKSTVVRGWNETILRKIRMYILLIKMYCDLSTVSTTSVCGSKFKTLDQNDYFHNMIVVMTITMEIIHIIMMITMMTSTVAFVGCPWWHETDQHSTDSTCHRWCDAGDDNFRNIKQAICQTQQR